MEIGRFFEDVLDQNKEGLRARFRGDAVIRWHCSNERFTVDEYIRANCEYPGRWDGEIEHVAQAGDEIVMAARVFPADRSASYHVVSFIRLCGEKIASLDEYWADDGEVPQWRRSMRIGKPIREDTAAAGRPEREGSTGGKT